MQGNDKTEEAAQSACAPKLFLSYSWSNPDHETWVLKLAEELQSSGIHVILDKWDLRDGHDAVAFMESMVSDDSIRKVAMICDEMYVAKADGRAGGVGTETQIISKRVYEEQKQEKFVALTLASRSDGQALKPIYYSSKIHIDFRDSALYAESFERVVRWVFDKPLYKRPSLGPPPAYVTESVGKELHTTPLFRRCLDALKTSKPFAMGALSEYFVALVEGLEAFRLVDDEKERQYDDRIVENIDQFRPYRNEAIEIFMAIARYSPTEEAQLLVHRLFEGLLLYYYRPESQRSCTDWDFDNYKFIVHELFLYIVAILLKFERFDFVSGIFVHRYYVPGRGRSEASGFGDFDGELKSLNYRNERLELRRTSLRADLLKERTAGTGIDFRDLMQADFVCFIRRDLAEDEYHRWWPTTLIYLSGGGPMEIFARAISRKYFDKVKAIFGISLKEDLEPLLNSYADRSKRLPPNWGYGAGPRELLAYDTLASHP